MKTNTQADIHVKHSESEASGFPSLLPFQRVIVEAPSPHRSLLKFRSEERASLRCKPSAIADAPPHHLACNSSEDYPVSATECCKMTTTKK